MKYLIKPCVIVFSGTVASGKSTQVILLCKKLRNLGLNVKTSYVRFNHIFAYLLTLLLAKIVDKNSKFEPLSTIHKYNPSLFNKLYKLWLAFFIISITIKYVIAIYLPYKLRRIVLVEDGILTTICDYLHILKAFNISSNAAFVTNYLLKMSKLCPDTYVVLLDASKKTLLNRWKIRGSFDIDKYYLCDPLDYVGYLKKMLPKLARNMGVRNLFVNTDAQTPDKVANIILRWMLTCQRSQ